MGNFYLNFGTFKFCGGTSLPQPNLSTCPGTVSHIDLPIQVLVDCGSYGPPACCQGPARWTNKIVVEFYRGDDIAMGPKNIMYSTVYCNCVKIINLV